MRINKHLEESLKHVQKPGRYIGSEWNEIKKNPERAKAKIALAFPDVYEIGMSHLGQKILYHVLNSQTGILAERVYAPWVDMEKELRKRNIPLFSLENKIPLSEFDVIGFSLLYELNYSNVLTILDLGRVPFFSKERDISSPLVIAGGPAVFNPEPIADIFDLFLIGDGETAFSEIVENYIALKDESIEKRTMLRELAKIKGVYVPSLFIPYRSTKSSLLSVKPVEKDLSPVKKRVLVPIHKDSFPDRIIVPNIQTVFDRVSVEVARGCPQSCRFCQAGAVYFPYRVRDPSFVMEKVLKNLQFTGYEDASLVALSVSDYPYLEETVSTLMGRLEKQKISLSLSALRPKGLASEIAENIVRVRKTGFTIVPEAGTERLRCVINKGLMDDDIWEAATNAFSKGWKLLKLYFMVGLPTEREEDLAGIINIVKEITKIGYKVLKKAPQINLSVSSFIPKPHTPFQWVKMEDEVILRDKHRYLRRGLKHYPFVRFKEHPLKSSLLEAVFSRGDRDLTPVLVESWKKGARFDSWGDMFNSPLWESVFKSKNIDYRQYLSERERDEILPWDHINSGIKKSHLRKELNMALREETTASCMEKDCSECQGCFLESSYEKSFSEKLNIKSHEYAFFGEETESICRYRAFYTKLDSARFLSQRDVNHIIQRGFRRAGISVSYSRGFHPKMNISHLPALPLGMEGKGEVCEFKSSYFFIEEDFISHVNKFLPYGIRFFKLLRLKFDTPSLAKDTEALVYSVNLDSQEILNSGEVCWKTEKKAGGQIQKSVIKDNFSEIKRKFLEVPLVNLEIDSQEKKLLLYFRYSPQNVAKPQEIVEQIFKVKNPAFLMAREKVLFKKSVDI